MEHTAPCIKKKRYCLTTGPDFCHLIGNRVTVVRVVCVLSYYFTYVFYGPQCLI